MRITPEYISQSITVSTRTEAMLITLNHKHYFVEYPTNVPPVLSKLGSKKGETISLINHMEFLTLKKCIEDFVHLKSKSPFLHAPSFIIGACSVKGIDLYKLNILT